MSVDSRTPKTARIRANRAGLSVGARWAGWAAFLDTFRTESRWSRNLAHLGGLAAFTAVLLYVGWRIGFTLPSGGWHLVAAWVLVSFEALPLIGLAIRLFTLWDLDCRAPAPVTTKRPGARVAVLIPTYNEPIEVIAPTIAAACELQPEHETWVLDDGDRPWAADLCAALGARYVTRPEHDHAKAGNMNHALEMMALEVEAGAEPIEIVAVLDCDHVPLPTFLTATLGWFDDPRIALVQAPQAYYNSGAFDDDGDTGEQGLFFHVLMPARNHDGAGPFWCGSTSLIRIEALQQIGGISTATIVEDMHTTLGLIRAGWKTAYHHQILAVGLAPTTPDQYLLQRRRWGMGSMQVLVRERLWAAKRWLSWRNYYEYLGGTLWWLEGIGTLGAFTIPAVVLVSGAQVSTANPVTFTVVFLAMFLVRMWGVKRLFRMHLHWPTSFALRILRVPVGISCLWWLVSRKSLKFQVTPKAGADDRIRGRAPWILWVLLGMTAAAVVYATAGLLGLVPWQGTASSTIASGIWLVIAGLVLVLGTQRIRAAEFASSRRNAYRVPLRADVSVNGVPGELVDISVGGAAVRLPAGMRTELGVVELGLPGADPIPMERVRVAAGPDGRDTISLRLMAGDWTAYRRISLWLFHTPPGVIEGIPLNAPAVAATSSPRRSRIPVLARQYG